MAINTDYGIDFDCMNDLTDTFKITSGRDNLIKACYRRLITPRGRLINDPNYGFYLQDYLNDDIDNRTIALIGSFVDNEMLKDERILKSITKCSFFSGILNVIISLYDSDGPFNLVLAVTSINITVLQAG